jgi:hypothetical protein
MMHRFDLALDHDAINLYFACRTRLDHVISHINCMIISKIMASCMHAKYRLRRIVLVPIPQRCIATTGPCIIAWRLFSRGIFSILMMYAASQYAVSMVRCFYTPLARLSHRAMLR